MAAKISPKLIDQATADELREAFANYLGEEIYVSSRAHEAWSHGTMSLEDFSLAREDDDIIESLVEIALGKLGFALPGESAAAAQ